MNTLALHPNAINFIKSLNSEFGITFKQRDSRFKTWLAAREFPERGRTAMHRWLGIIVPCGNAAETKEFYIQVVTSNYTLCADCYEQRDEQLFVERPSRVRYQDNGGILERIQPSIDAKQPLYCLFEEHVNDNGRQEIYLLSPCEDSADPGVFLHDASCKKRNTEWIERVFFILNIGKAERTMVLKQDPYPADYHLVLPSKRMQQTSSFDGGDPRKKYAKAV